MGKNPLWLLVFGFAVRPFIVLPLWGLRALGQALVTGTQWVEDRVPGPERF